MRVLAGIYKSKKIETINSRETRPMMSKVREAIFNSIQFMVGEKDILDLYSGSGSLGIEALSRGANYVTFVESSKECIFVLKKNVKNINNNYSILDTTVNSFIKNSLNKYHLVFYDPPFSLDTKVINEEIFIIEQIMFDNGLLIVHRHKSSEKINISKNYEIHREKNYGQSKILILRRI
tara:strand:+ start:2502 stop:3038 length:537 start_codon:yes stop_codon:yes gene_type:complete